MQTPDKKVQIIPPVVEGKKKSALIPKPLDMEDAEGKTGKPRTPGCVASILLARRRRRKIPTEAFERLQEAVDGVFIAEETLEIRQKEFLSYMLDDDDDFEMSGLQSQRKKMRKDYD